MIKFTQLEQCRTVIVVPYYEDTASATFCLQLSEYLSLEDRLVVVDDGSIRSPFDCRVLSENGLSGLVISLSRNVGHQTAIACGISKAKECYEFERLVVMDSDGEDRPQDIERLTSELETSTETDVVVATRKSRQETIRFKLFYLAYQLFFKLLVGKKIRFGNFMAMNRATADRLSHYAETPMHLAATLMHSRLRIKELPTDRGARYAGKSQMNLVSLTLHGLRSIMVFAEDVLVRLTLFCAAAATLIATAMVIMVATKLFGLAIPGWFSTVSGILLLLLLQLAMITLLVLLSAGNMRSRVTSKFDYHSLIKRLDHVHAEQ